MVNLALDSASYDIAHRAFLLNRYLLEGLRGHLVKAHLALDCVTHG
jgi:hypothetical protein